MHVHVIEELYQASWRPMLVDNVSAFPQNIPEAPTPSSSVADHQAASKAPTPKAAGAYRPPGARGLATPTIYKREDEGGAAYISGGGTSTPPRQFNRSPQPPGANGLGHHLNGNGRAERGRRHVPGAAPSPSPVRGEGDRDKEKKKRTRTKRKPEGPSGAATPLDGDDGAGAEAGAGDEQTAVIDAKLNGMLEVPGGGAPPIAKEDSDQPAGQGDASLDQTAKKVRNLNKKLKAIDELKEKAKRGERLEATQVKKMEGEAELRAELTKLSAASA